MILTTLESIPGKQIVRICGLVRGNTVRAKHIGKDILAGLKQIVGGEIKASAWEILCAMIVFEAAFGLQGLVAAPIFYAYGKSELRQLGLI